jgi:5-(carboxyamino)imidazole ribonucleotide mutase
MWRHHRRRWTLRICPGAVASMTTLPVIGVPIASGALNGVDALYAIVQMPGDAGATVATIDGAYNAGRWRRRSSR